MGFLWQDIIEKRLMSTRIRRSNKDRDLLAFNQNIFHSENEKQVLNVQLINI